MLSFSWIGSFFLRFLTVAIRLNYTGMNAWLAPAKAGTTSGGLLHRRPDEVYYLFERGSGLEYSRDAQLLQLGSVLVRNYTSDGDQHVVHAFLAQQFHYPRNDRIVRAGEDGQPDNLDIFL